MHQLAVIGAGRIGKIHAANAWAHPALAVKYVTDPIIDAAEELASSIGAQVAAFEDVIADPSIAGIVVASSTDTHLDFSIRTVEAYRANLMMKMDADSLSDLVRMTLLVRGEP